MPRSTWYIAAVKNTIPAYINDTKRRLFDSDRFRRHIEAAYTRMWEIWQRGEGPRSFRVERSG